MDNATSVELNCQFSSITFNPFFYYTVLIGIYPNSFSDAKYIAIALNGYTASRYTDNFQFNDQPYLSVEVYTPMNENVSAWYFDALSNMTITDSIYTNLYEVDPQTYDFVPTFCIDDYITNWFVSFIQTSFQTDIFNPQLRPFLPVLKSNFSQSLDLEICNSTNSFVFDGGIWSPFRTGFEELYLKLIDEIEITYTCFDIEKEANFDYFMRVSAYSFLITLVLLFIQFSINIFVALNFKGEVKEIWRKHTKRNPEQTTSE